MKRIAICLSVWMMGGLAFAQQSGNSAYFASHPSLTPDGKSVIFSYEGDLWQTDLSSKVARRITALPGEEINPRISPDGKWLAFSSNQYGNHDIFIMPLAGGEIKQLTYHDANDEVDSWSWDSQTIYFTSGRYNRFSSYSVSKDGGTAKRLFPHYFNTIHQVVEMPNGELLFNNSWESYSAANRKRYKGSFNPDVLSYHPKSGDFKKLTDYEGKDFWQTVDRQGNVYYVSDEANGEYNLYALNNGSKKQLTRFNTSIKRPQVSANGEKVVFERDYQLYVYDVASAKAELLNISVSRNKMLEKAQEFDVKDNISAFDVSPDGKKLAFVARGVLFVSDISGKFVREIHSSPERAFEVKWLKDNKTLLVSRTWNGYPNWVAVSADGTGSVKQVTKDARSNRGLFLNATRTHGVYLSGRDEVRLIDLATLESKAIVKDEIWAFQNSNPSFSPDGEYVLFTAVRNFEQDIFVHHIKSSKTTNLTNTGVSETSPAWSADGRSIYFASNRTKPSYPFGMQNASIYKLDLDYFDGPYRTDKFDELFQESKKDSTSTNGITISINTQNIRDRITQISPAFGSQTNVFTLRKGKKDYVFFHSNHEGGRMAVYRTIIQDFEQNKTEKVADGFISDYAVSGPNYYLLTRGGIQKYNLDNNRLEPIAISQKFHRNLNDEFKQMFYETWAGLEENFYESGFHGLNWEKTRDNYAKFLPYVTNRNDLRVLLNDMLGELNSSHLGFSSSGREEQKLLRFVTNETGIIFDSNNPYKVSRVMQNSPASKIGRDIQPGDVLVAVDGEQVDPSMDRDFYFTKPSLMEELRLTFNRNGNLVNTTVRPQRSASLRDAYYDEWIKKNRHRVDSLSNNRIAYSHMKNMSTSELEVFLLDMVEQENNKEAIILDLRYNTGGNVHDEVLKFLSQRPYLQWQYRGGKRSPQSNFAPAGKPIVLLINQQSLSDAEMTAAGFKALQLGKIIGTETYRWIIFTSSKGLVDGSSYRVPGWGVYTLQGDNLELTGVKPDISVDNTFVDLVKDKDPQLERAIQEILKQL